MTGTFIGDSGTKFDNVRRIAVLRGGGLGDLMFAMPAISALAAAYPGAGIVLLGTPAAKALLAHRPSPVSEVVELPFAEGVRPGPEDPDEIAAFFAEMRARQFDLAVQIHGGGRYSNPFLLQLGARHTVGTQTPDATPLDRNLPYVYYQNEFDRGLEVVGLAGAPVAELDPKLPVTAAEREAATTLLAGGGVGQKILAIHPGATDPRRRWPAQSFAEVAEQAAGAGWHVVVVGDDSDVAAANIIVEHVRKHMPAASHGSVQSLAGTLTLSELLGVLSIADVMLGNDSGPRHLAAAVGTKTVGLFWFGNLINAGPRGRSRHRVHLSWVTRCPVCGVDVTQVGWTAERCEHDPSFLTEIDVAAVYADVCALT